MSPIARVGMSVARGCRSVTFVLGAWKARSWLVAATSDRMCVIHFVFPLLLQPGGDYAENDGEEGRDGGGAGVGI